MLTRKEAQKYVIADINREIEEHGEDYIFLECPQRGKNQWNLAEIKYAIENDMPMENYGGKNLIDELLVYEEYLNGFGKSIKD